MQQNQETKEKMLELAAELKSMAHLPTTGKGASIAGENIWAEIDEAGEKSQEVQALSKERKRLQYLLNKSSKEHDEQVAFWKDKHQNVVAQTLELEKENAHLQVEIAGLTNTVEDLEFAARQQEHEISNLVKEVDRLRGVLSQVGDYQKKVAQLEEHTAKMDSSTSDFEQHVGLIGKTVSELETSNLNLYEKVSSEVVREKHQNVMAQMGALKKEIDQIVRPDQENYPAVQTKEVVTREKYKKSEKSDKVKYYETQI